MLGLKPKTIFLGLKPKIFKSKILGLKPKIFEI